jgi:hypothetical protein
MTAAFYCWWVGWEANLRPTRSFRGVAESASESVQEKMSGFGWDDSSLLLGVKTQGTELEN